MSQRRSQTILCGGVSTTAHTRRHYNTASSSLLVSRRAWPPQVDSSLRVARPDDDLLAHLEGLDAEVRRRRSLGKHRWSHRGRTLLRPSIRVTSEAVQIRGGYGFTDACNVSRLFRAARYGSLGGGTPETLREEDRRSP